MSTLRFVLVGLFAAVVFLAGGLVLWAANGVRNAIVTRKEKLMNTNRKSVSIAFAYIVAVVVLAAVVLSSRTSFPTVDAAPAHVFTAYSSPSQVPDADTTTLRFGDCMGDVDNGAWTYVVLPNGDGSEASGDLYHTSNSYCTDGIESPAPTATQVVVNKVKDVVATIIATLTSTPDITTTQVAPTLTATPIAPTQTQLPPATSEPTQEVTSTPVPPTSTPAPVVTSTPKPCVGNPGVYKCPGNSQAGEMPSNNPAFTADAPVTGNGATGNSQQPVPANHP